MTTERKEFEYWYIQYHEDDNAVKRYATNPDRYYYAECDTAWDAWQAATARQEEKIAILREALTYHQEQTRPIEKTKEALEKTN